MKIEIVPFASAIDPGDLLNKTVVVIDVLRATSVIITALLNGANKIIPVLTVEDALYETEKFHPGKFLLCGERNAKKIDGFDLGNSPLEYTSKIVKNKTIILTTTNGTKALQACNESKKVIIAAFLNINAVVQKVKNIEELVLVCSGTNGKFSLDDGICTAFIIHELSKITPVNTDDLGQVLLNTISNAKLDLEQILRDCYHVNYLLDHGFADDVKYCFQLNTTSLVPEYYKNDGSVKLK